MIRSCGMPLIIFYSILLGFEINFLVILVSWLTSSIISSIIGIWYINESLDLKIFIKNISIYRYFNSLKLSRLILLMAFTYQVIFFLDRFFVKELFHEAVVAEYFFVAMISLVILAIVDAGVSSFFLPKSYLYSSNQMSKELKNEMHKNLFNCSNDSNCLIHSYMFFSIS